jgi:hypothetical protein
VKVPFRSRGTSISASSKSPFSFLRLMRLPDFLGHRRAVVEGVKQWQSRPLEPLYPILFLDALMVKMRHEGRVVCVSSIVNTDQKIIKNKVGLLNLAQMLGSVSQACKMMGVFILVSCPL